MAVQGAAIRGFLVSASNRGCAVGPRIQGLGARAAA